MAGRSRLTEVARVGYPECQLEAKPDIERRAEANVSGGPGCESSSSRGGEGRPVTACSVDQGHTARRAVNRDTAFSCASVLARSIRSRSASAYCTSTTPDPHEITRVHWP